MSKASRSRLVSFRTSTSLLSASMVDLFVSSKFKCSANGTVAQNISLSSAGQRLTMLPLSRLRANTGGLRFAVDLADFDQLSLNLISFNPTNATSLNSILLRVNRSDVSQSGTVYRRALLSSFKMVFTGLETCSTLQLLIK